MWCARNFLSRPGSTVVVRAGRNWAAFGSPFFYLRSSFQRRRYGKQPVSVKRVAPLLCSVRQKRGVLGFTGVVGAGKAGSQAPFIERLTAPFTHLGGGTDATCCFKCKRDGVRKISRIQHGNLQ